MSDLSNLFDSLDDSDLADISRSLNVEGRDPVSYALETDKKLMKIHNEPKKECGPGQYYCFDEKKCKPLPDGHKVRKDGEMVKESKITPEKISELFENYDFEAQEIKHPVKEFRGSSVKAKTPEAPKTYYEELIYNTSKHISHHASKRLEGDPNPAPKTDVDLRIEGLENQFNMWKSTLTESLGGMGGRNLVSGIGQGGDGQTPGGGAVWLWDLDDVSIGSPQTSTTSPFGTALYPPIPNGSVMIWSTSEEKWVLGAVTLDQNQVKTTRDLTLVNALTYREASTFSNIGIDETNLKVQEDLNLAFAAKFADHEDEITALQAGGGGKTYMLNADTANDGKTQITLTDQDDNYSNVKFVATGGASLSVANDIITIDTSGVSGGTTFLGGIDAAVDPSTLQGSPVGGHYFVYKAAGTAWEGTAVNRGDWAAYSAEDSAWEVLNYTGGGNGNGTVTSVGVSGGVLALAGTAGDPVINLDPSDIISLTVAQHYTKAEIDARVLDDLADVSAPAPANGSHLIYSTTNNKWGAGTAGAAVNIGDNPPSGPEDGDLWFDSAELQLHVYYTDNDSSQWVVATNPVTPDLTTLVAKSGDTMTGALILNADPTVDLGAATKQYVDNLVSDPATGYLPLSGGQITGLVNFKNTRTASAGTSTSIVIEGRTYPFLPQSSGDMDQMMLWSHNYAEDDHRSDWIQYAGDTSHNDCLQTKRSLDAAIAIVQADVDQNEADADAQIALTNGEVNTLVGRVNDNETNIGVLQASIPNTIPFNWKLRTADFNVGVGYFHYTSSTITLHTTENGGTQFAFVAGQSDDTPRSYTVYARNSNGYLMRRSGTVNSVTYYANNTLAVNITEKIVGSGINNNEAYYITISGLF